MSRIIGIVGDAGNAVCVNAKPQLDSETVLPEGKDPTLVLSERPIGLSERGSGGESGIENKLEFSVGQVDWNAIEMKDK